MIRPRLLFLGHTVPYPPDRGAALRSYHILRELSRRYEVDALFFRRSGEPTQMPLEDRVRHLEALAHVQLFPIPAERSPLRRAWDGVQSVVTGRNQAEWHYDSRTYRRQVLETVFERDPRIVHVDSMVLHPYLPLLVGRTVVLAHHWWTTDPAAGVTGTADQRASDTESWIERVEREWTPRVSVNLVATEQERARVLERAQDARIETVPLAVDTRHFTPAAGTGHGLAYVGGTVGPASRDALEHFDTEILPKLRRVSGVQALEPISWVGMAREGDRDRYRAHGIDIMGHVEDIRPVVRPAACFIVPRRLASGGTRILQAWAMGKAVVSTSVGCDGLETVDGRNILIRDDADSFARAVLDVLQDGDLRRRLGEEGRKTVETTYSWDERGQELTDLYQGAEGTSPLQPVDQPGSVKGRSEQG